MTSISAPARARKSQRPEPAPSSLYEVEWQLDNMAQRPEGPRPKHKHKRGATRRYLASVDMDMGSLAS